MNPGMKTQWNTGRVYCSDGQRMSARIDPANVVVFSDHSRGINGLIPLGNYVRFEGPRDLRDFVMWNYDRGNYSGSQVWLKWEDE